LQFDCAGRKIDVTPLEREQKQVDALLASYTAAKDEIGRRSALSWTAVGGYIAFILAAFKTVLDDSDWKKAVWAVSTWLIACLAYQFYNRENQEILRLSDIIRDTLEVRVRQLVLAYGSPLFMEREDPKDVWKRTRISQCVSEWALFLGGPAIVTAFALAILFLHCISQMLHFLFYVLITFGGIIIGACAAVLVRLLNQHAKWW
jgi:hypothetical protein